MNLRRRAQWWRSVLAAVCLLVSLSVQAAWPERGITLVVGWPQGMATDLIARQLAMRMEIELKQPVTVVNRLSRDGAFAHTEVAYANPDGYTLGLVTPDFIGSYWEGVVNFTYERYTPLAMVEFSPAALWVKSNGTWRNAREAITAWRRHPKGTYRISGATLGGAYHLALAGFLRANGMPPDQLAVSASTTSEAGFQYLVAGGSDLCPESLHEGKAVLGAGKARALAVFAKSRLPAFGDVPTVKEALGKDYVAGTWRGVVAPAGLAPEIRERLNDVLERIIGSEEFRRFMDQRGFGRVFLRGDQFGQFLADMHRQWGAQRQELGLPDLRRPSESLSRELSSD
jgi:tripartite-type tricarboxylate transporter receptor subunit TctC